MRLDKFLKITRIIKRTSPSRTISKMNTTIWRGSKERR